jgi:hypothetical protein
MACGCGGKTTAKMDEQAPAVHNNADGSLRTVRLGLKPHFALPLRFLKAIDGRDLLVVTGKMNLPRRGNTIIMVGRNARVKPEYKVQLVTRWPHVFEDT